MEANRSRLCWRGGPVRAFVVGTRRASRDLQPLSIIKARKWSRSGDLTSTHSFHFSRNYERRRGALAGALRCRPEFRLPQCACVGGGDEESLQKRLRRRSRQEAVCAELRAMSRQQSSGNRTGAVARPRSGKKRKAGRVVLVHHQGKTGIGDALVVKPAATAALADRDFPGVARQHQGRGEVTCHCCDDAKSAITEL